MSEPAANPIEGIVAWVERPALARVILALGAGLLVLQIVSAPRLNHDVAQYLAAGQRVLEGDRPFVELIDTNPPVILYLSAIPAAAASVTGLSITVCGLLFFCGLFLLAFGLLATALAGFLSGTSGTDHVAPFVVAAGAAWLHLLGTTYQVGYLAFGQRDAIIGALLLPLVVLRFSRYAGRDMRRSFAVAIGIAALVAVGMKPPFVLALGLIEAAAFIRYRRLPPLLTPEVAAFALSGLAYALHFLVVPGMSAFYTRWVAFIAAGYEAYNAPLYVVVARFLEPSPVWLGLPAAMAVGLCALLVLYGALSSDPAIRVGGTLALFALGAAALFVVQQKAWRYQLLPFHFAALTAFAVTMTRVVPTMAAWASTRAVPLAGPAQIALVLVLLAAFEQEAGFISSLRPARLGDPPRYALADSIQALTEPDERVLVISTSVRGAFPAITYAERPTAGRYLCAFPLAFFYSGSSGYQDLGEWVDEEAEFYAGLLDDIAASEPRLILIRTGRGPQATPPFFSIPEYLRRRGFYEAVAPQYVRSTSVAGFEVLRRRPALVEGADAGPA